MQLKLLQLTKTKLSVQQELIFTAAMSAFLIVITCAMIVFLNSTPKQSKAAVTLDLFTATLNSTGTQVQCYWVTEIESNNDHFNIERSADGISYTNVAQLPGAGISLSQLTYTYTDTNPLNGISFYRLKQTDVNGEYQYGAIQSVNNENATGGGSINIYPMPAVNNVFVEINSTAITSAVISVVDLTGKIAKFINADLYEGKNKIKLDISSLPNGIYFVSAEGADGFKLSQKMIKTE